MASLLAASVGQGVFGWNILGVCVVGCWGTSALLLLLCGGGVWFAWSRLVLALPGLVGLVLGRGGTLRTTQWTRASAAACCPFGVACGCEQLLS